jgi:hypothetical protein
MRTANDGDFDVRKATNDDPIGMLSNAFSFTIGRFRRFILRNQTVVQQLEILSQRGSERADKFLVKMRDLLDSTHFAHTIPSSSSPPFLPGNFRPTAITSESGQESVEIFNISQPQLKSVRERVQRVARQDIENNSRAVLSLVEQALHHCHSAASELRTSHARSASTTIVQDLGSLDTIIRQLGRETQSFQQAATPHLTEIDTNLSYLPRTTNQASSPGISSGLTPIQMQELSRTTENFASEVIALTENLSKITHDMRASLTPFRLETTSSGVDFNG